VTSRDAAAAADCSSLIGQQSHARTHALVQKAPAYRTSPDHADRSSRRTRIIANLLIIDQIGLITGCIVNAKTGSDFSSVFSAGLIRLNDVIYNHLSSSGRRRPCSIMQTKSLAKHRLQRKQCIQCFKGSNELTC